MSYNTITLSLTDQSVTNVLAHIAAIRAEIPRVVGLSKEAKAKLAKMGKKRLVWSKDAYEYAQQYPLLLTQARPLSVWAQVKRDYDHLGVMLKNLATLYRALLDTFTVLGADYYAFALDFYEEVQANGNDSQPGLLEVLEVLQKQFEGQGLTQEPEPSDDPLASDSNGGNTNGGNTNGGGSNGGNAPA